MSITRRIISNLEITMNERGALRVRLAVRTALSFFLSQTSTARV